jgi:hypothetical protein
MGFKHNLNFLVSSGLYLENSLRYLCFLVKIQINKLKQISVKKILLFQLTRAKNLNHRLFPD